MALVRAIGTLTNGAPAVMEDEDRVHGGSQEGHGAVDDRRPLHGSEPRTAG